MRIPAGAVWIGSDHPFDLHEVYLNFRYDFEIASLPSEAKLTITADSRYKLWINGSYIARGPSRCWPNAQQVDEHDVARHLRQGTNTIAVQVYSPGYSHFAYVHRGACGLLAWLEGDGKTLLVTNSAWSVQRDISWASSVNRISIYGSGVERRDMRLAQHNSSSGWSNARIVALAEGPIWSGLSLRDVPLLIENYVEIESPGMQFRRGHVSGLPDDPHEALRQAWQATQPIKQKSPNTINIGRNECAIWTGDVGYSRIGHGRVKISGAKGGERLLISYAEKIRDGELILPDPTTYCRMRPTDEFILRAGEQSIEPFSQRGGRYIIFCIHSPESVTIELELLFETTAYPIEDSLNDREMSGVSFLCEQTLQGCLQDGFVDSVWRESSQWLGDCVAQAFAFQAISDDVRPLRRAITMAALGAYADGVLPSVLPGEAHAYTVLDYNFSWVELLQMYVEHPAAADREDLISAQWSTLCKMLERFDADRNADGLIISQPGRRLFLDWSAVDRREPSLTYNGRYLHALQIASRLARWAGEDHSAAIWSARADRLGSSMITAFRRQDAWCENHLATPASQLGLALVVLTDCAQGQEAEALCQRIIARSLDLDDGHEADKLVLASPFMHHYIFQALDKQGHQRSILDIIRARWGRWAAAGEATCWENWSIDFPDGSACHGFSAHPLGWIKRCQAALSR